MVQCRLVRAAPLALLAAACSPAERWNHEVFVEVRLAPAGWPEAAVRAVQTWQAALAPYGVHVQFGWPGDVLVIAPSLGDTVALTNVVSDVATGDILHAVVQLNRDTSAWSAARECTGDRFDVEATVAHELGHAFGLQHTSDPDDTMFGDPLYCNVGARTLSAGDVAQIEAIYGEGPH